MVKIKTPDNFRHSLLEAIESNRLEILMPSREYFDSQVYWMDGYQQALEDMLGDYDNNIQDIIKNTLTFSLN